MFSADSRLILPEPPGELKRLSRALIERVAERMRREGPLPFSEYMDMALYEPGLGYYSAGLAKFGADGDFVTSPELGGVFASCVAAQAREIGATLGSWDMLEIGAGSGRFAAAFGQAIDPGHAPARYRILERSADLRQLQHRRLEREAPQWLERVEWLDTPPAAPWRGLLFANEVVDALPVERFRLRGGCLQRLMVTRDEHEPEAPLAWDHAPAGEALEAAIRGTLGEHLDALPDGYCSEICHRLPAWLDAVSSGLSEGVALFVDYGYPRREYYAPERHEGTLVCHYRHRAHDDPFTWPGLQDISAFVDFTALAEAADAAGFEVLGYTSQAQFLIACGLEARLAGLEALPERRRLELSREVRMLTLPSAMGEKFQCMALGRGFQANLRGFSGPDLSYRL